MVDDLALTGSIDDILVGSAYDGFFMGRPIQIINAPQEIALPALKRLCGPKGTALAWHKYGEAFRFMLVSNDPTWDAGVIAGRFVAGDGTKEVSTFQASKLLVSG